MKLFLVLFAVTLCLSGCYDNIERDSKGREVYQQGKANCYGRLEYIVFDGHEYVRWRNHERGGITHSPKCKCLEGRK